MYRINGKNLSIARLIPRGKDSDSARMQYMHASSKGTAIIAPTVVARVSLPPQGPDMDDTPTIWPTEKVDELLAAKGSDVSKDILVEPGRPAVTGADYMVPKLDPVFPDAQEQSASFTVNAELLLKVLKAACEVTTDAEKAVRLRFCPGRNVLRVDTYRQPGEQEFVAVIQELEYCGENIPGDKPSDAPPVENKPKPAKLGELKVNAGRKFRA